MTSCEKDFLETTPTTEISDQDVFKTTDGAQTVLNGLYRWLREYNSGGTDRHEDMGQKSVDITLDVLDGRDVIINAPGWYYFDHDLAFDFTQANYTKTEGLWEFYYKIINNCNNIIVNIDESEGDSEEKNRIKGEALALRAHSYFYLVNIFQHAYIEGPDQPGVPIYLEPATPESEGNPRGTVQDVYDQILSDLDDALELLPESGTRGNKSHININVAQGILARTHLFMGNWAEAATAAAAAREGFPLDDAATYTSGFNDIDANGEWIWGLPFQQDQQHFYYSFFSMYDLERSAGYQHMRMNSGFLAEFTDTDIRAKLAVNDYPLVVDKMDEPFNASGYVTEADQYVIRKFRDKADQTGHYVLMRSAEMILIEAEAEAELDNFERAQDLLFEVQSRADVNAVKSTNTGQALIDEILLERRKELYGEGLASTLDLKRRLLPLERVGNHYFTGSLPAGSNMLTWQIPQSEIDANENIGVGDQNPL
ncbi:MAG: RagB/SusD family nutrient uptake outer membrane protein [Thiohalospira sp.]